MKATVHDHDRFDENNQVASKTNSTPIAAAFQWRHVDNDPIPDEIPVLVFNEKPGEKAPLMAITDGDYLFIVGANTETLDWNFIQWWAYVPPTPDAGNKDTKEAGP